MGVHNKFLRMEENSEFEFCIVWTNLPLITWLCPVIGHTGIGDSTGVIHDFQGHYVIGLSKKTMAFNVPRKMMKIPLTPAEHARLDKAIKTSDDAFRSTKHNILTNNCHHHVIDALNNFGYLGRRDWTQIDLALHLFFRGTYLSWFDVFY